MTMKPPLIHPPSSLDFSVKSFNAEEKAISEKLGLSGEAVEILSGLNEIQGIKRKMNRKEILIFSEQLKNKFNCLEVDEIMNSNINDEIYLEFMISNFIENPNFYKIFYNYATYALQKTILSDYEKWATEYLKNNLTDEIIEGGTGYKFDSLNQSKKTVIRELSEQKIMDVMTKVLFQSDISNGDHECLSFMFYKEVQKVMDSIIFGIEKEVRNTKQYQLLIINYTKSFEKIFKEYMPTFTLE